MNDSQNLLISRTSQLFLQTWSPPRRVLCTMFGIQSQKIDIIGILKVEKTW